MKILVTGSKGLVGRHLCRVLRCNNVEVFEFDVNCNPSDSHYGDVRDFDLCFQAVSKVDGVFHLAAMSRVVWAEINPLLCEQININGTRNIIDACLKSKTSPWLLFASSREVYGQKSIFPVKETDSFAPLNKYARSKVEGEKYIKKAHDRGLKVGIARLSSVYGDILDHETRVVPSFVKAALQNIPLIIQGEQNFIDLTNVQDVVNGLIKYSHQIMANSPMNPIHFVSGNHTYLLDLAKKIIEISGSSSNIEITHPRNYDVSQFWGTYANARNSLNWQPNIPLAVGLKDLITNYKNSSIKESVEKDYLARLGGQRDQPL